MRSNSLRASLLTAALAVCVTSCNAVVGAGAVVVLGGVGYFATQCYDRVQVRVVDPATGNGTCDAEVTVTDTDGSERRMRPCYNTALTEGHWRIRARQPGYAPATSELTIPEHEGSCPYYVHSIQLTMRREGEPSTPPIARTRSPEHAPAPPPSPAGDLESPPARVVPPPIPGVPTKAFAPVPPAPPPSAPPEPAPAQPAPPAPAPSPPPTPGPAQPPASAPR